VVAAAAALALSGCIAVGDVGKRAMTVNQEVGSSQNQFVLLNLVRAAHEEPVYFVAFNQLGASGTMEFRAGVPQVFSGPRLPAASQIAEFVGGTNFLDNQTNTNFQMSLLGSQDFYSGLLAPLGLRDVDLMLNQGYSRELIFYLVIAKAKITIVSPDGTPSAFPPQVIYNDPSDTKNFALFQYYIREAMNHGLTTETYEAPDDTASDAGATDSTGKAAAKKPQLTTKADLCYDKAMALPADLPDIAKGSFCGDKPSIRPAATGAATPLYVTLHDPTFPLHDQKLQIDVTTRSIYEIYYYLGRIIRSGQPMDLQAFDLPAEKIPQEPLIDVLTNQGLLANSSCFSAVRYENEVYCVPLEGAENTKHIFGILNALIALKQSTGDIPVTQTVRIEQ
jgi:hypothetical protein